jgi:hypothetical protein
MHILFKQQAAACSDTSISCDLDCLSFPDWRTRKHIIVKTSRHVEDAKLLSCVLTRDGRWSNSLGTYSVRSSVRQPNSLTLGQSTIKKYGMTYL